VSYLSETFHAARSAALSYPRGQAWSVTGYGWAVTDVLDRLARHLDEGRALP
jgi:hypothetical protein